ncbi:hypothetical protein AB0F72_37105 [Actinoplanes sp. NPDC023936]|uniref:hypothetical protein n=1 Tax=Actinoplanes sp. NPDC023936 TaxID=3154910 RepID=UPI0033D7D756
MRHVVPNDFLDFAAIRDELAGTLAAGSPHLTFVHVSGAGTDSTEQGRTSKCLHRSDSSDLA